MRGQVVQTSKGGANIKSVQRGTILATAQTTDVTISPVDIDNSIVISSSSVTTTTDSINYNTVRANLSTNTNLQLTTAAYSTSYRATTAWQVIEFEDVKSIQRGTSTVGEAGVNITINAVDLSKTFVYASMALYSPISIARYQLTSATNLYMYSKNTSLLSWYVVEFN